MHFFKRTHLCFQFRPFHHLHVPNLSPDVDFHYACAAASEDGISVVCYEVTKSSKNNVTVGVIHQSHATFEEGSGEGRQVQNRTTVPSEKSIPMAKFRFGQPCVSPSGKVTLLDGGHCKGPHRDKPVGTIFVWRQGINGVDNNSLIKLNLSEGDERIEHINLHVFDDDTAYVSIIPNIVKKPMNENVKHFKCNLQDGTAQLLEPQDERLPPFIMKSRKADQIILFNNSKTFFQMNVVQETPIMMELGGAGQNEIQYYSNDMYPAGIKSKYKLIQNESSGIGDDNHLENGGRSPEEPIGMMLIKTQEEENKIRVSLIKDPNADIEKIQEYEEVNQDGVKFAISDDGQYVALAVNGMKDNCFIDIYSLPSLNSTRFSPSALYSGFDDQSVCEIGALVFTPESMHRPQHLAVALRTKSEFFVTFHEISQDKTKGQKPCIQNTKYAVLKDNLSDWDRTKRPRYYDLQASQDFMIIAGSNIGAFMIPYSFELQ